MQLRQSSDPGPPRASGRTPVGAATDVVSVQDIEVVLGATTALSGVTTALRSGEAAALMGANGSGKSTMMRAILNLVPHTGAVELFGVPQQQFRQWRRIGYVPQYSDPALQRATVREVVASGRLARRRPFALPSRTERRLVSELIARVGLAGQEKWEMSQLSGGQQQRARIARALATRPELLALDEPLAGLDMASQHGLAELLDQFKTQGMAMLIVLHELGPLGPLMDRALILDHGHLVHDGPPPTRAGQTQRITSGQLSLHADCLEHQHGHDHYHEHSPDQEDLRPKPGLVDSPWIGDRR